VGAGLGDGAKEDRLLSAYLRHIPSRLFIFSVVGLALSWLFTGCSSPSVNPVSGGPQVTITANPSTINPGGSSTLTITVSNATQVTLSGSDGTTYTIQAAGGTQVVKPSATTTYTAVATGAGGKTTATAMVTVSASAPTVSITANPASITQSTSSLLTVAATNATQVTITGTDGSSYNLSATGGTQAVTPTVTTTYTATATGAGGTVQATAVVTVTANPAPTISITANPTSITQSTSSLLTVAATNATQVTVTGTDGSSYTLSVTGGTQAVSPTVTTTYTATATGTGGTATATAVVTVTPNPAPTVTITASPSSINSGGSSTLTVVATYATAVTVTGSDGSSYTLQPSGGTQAVTPAATTNYTATATGPGGSASASATVTISTTPAPTVALVANPTVIVSGNASTLTATATNAAQVIITGTDGSSYTLPAAGGNQSVTPTATTTYTATATAVAGTGTATAGVTVTITAAGGVQAIDHVIFMLQENHSFDNYFGMLNPYRHANNMYMGQDGNDYEVDGIDDKLTTISNEDDQGTTYSLFPFTSTCVDDMSSDWLSSYGDVDRYNFTTTRTVALDGFVHDAEGYADSCPPNGGGACAGSFTDLTGQRAMGYYYGGSSGGGSAPDFLNYYYYMASQFAVSDRWFSPVASKSIDNRIATFSGGTTQGLTKDPGGNDHLPQLNLPSIFQELDAAQVSWKIYYTVTEGFCTAADIDDCSTTGDARYPATDFGNFTYSYRYLYVPSNPGTCTPPTQPSIVVGDSANTFCIDTDHIAPISQYYSDLTNNTLPSFAFIEAGYGNNDEHPGSGQSILKGQAEVANVVNALMASPSNWSDSVFFFSYDEGGGPYDHVPPVPGHSNDNTDASLGAIPDIASIAVSPDGYYPCLPDGSSPNCNCPPGQTTPSTHCDLASTDPGATAGDAAYENGFGAQLGFRLPNIIISPFTRQHYVSHTPMDHTAVIEFVENRFINTTPGTPPAHLTARDAAQPNLLEFFDFTNIPWAAPPTPPTPYSDPQGTNSCTPQSMGPSASQKKTPNF
jgi:phospholipase C